MPTNFLPKVHNTTIMLTAKKCTKDPEPGLGRFVLIIKPMLLLWSDQVPTIDCLSSKLRTCHFPLAPWRDLHPHKLWNGPTCYTRVIIDKFTKYGHFILLKKTYLNAKVEEALLEKVYKLHGFLQNHYHDKHPLYSQVSFGKLVHKLWERYSISTMPITTRRMSNWESQ